MRVQTHTFQEDGQWFERIGVTVYPWDERPLCSCEWADDAGDPEVGPDPYIVREDPACERCTALGRPTLPVGA